MVHLNFELTKMINEAVVKYLVKYETNINNNNEINQTPLFRYVKIEMKL